MGQVLAGAVLELQRRAEQPLPIGKKCSDCAHRVASESFDYCGRTSRLEPATQKQGHWTCAAERGSDLAEDCGPNAIHFIPTAAAEAARSVRRLQRQREIEDAIIAHNPDVQDIQELLGALESVLASRYEDRAADALEQARDFRQALEELESTLGRLDA